MTDDRRSDPEALLNRIKNEEERTHKGRLKIFFGSSAGVGKTYNMLSAAHEAAKQGADVLIGYVETHGRPYTEQLLEGLRVLPPKVINHNGIPISEFDLDAALTRAPEILVLDELAHTNAPGVRHPKRWNDVVELLDAGINVYTTLNVQHLESLSDLVAGTTGVWVKETVPDSVFDMAEDVVLIDIDSDDLLKRLHEGNIYIAPGANKRAAENFFRKDNLNALREIALRRTAQRVDAERDTSDLTADARPIADKIMVCIDADDMAPSLIRSAKRLSTALKAPWIAAYYEKIGENTSSSSHNERHRIIETLDRMVSRLSGKTVILHGDSILDEILSYSAENGITKILIGKKKRPFLIQKFRRSLAEALVRQSNFCDILILSVSSPEKGQKTPAKSAFADFKPFNYMIAFLAVACFTIPGFALPNVLTDTDQALLYLTGVVLVAENAGLGPSLFYALLAASAFNIFFSPQHLNSLNDHRAYLMTFVMMLITGYAIATQSSRLKNQAVTARDKEKKTRALYELTRQLTAKRGRFPVSETVSLFMKDIHDVDTTVWMINSDGHPSVVLGDLPTDTYYKDFAALEWCFDNNKMAGLGTSTMPSAAGLYLPLSTGSGILGVMGAYPRTKERLFSYDEISSMETLAGLLASALERVRAGELVAQTTVERESQKLRDSLVSAIGQSFQEPLSTISDSVSSILNSAPELNTDLLLDATGSLHKEAQKLGKTVGHILDVSRIEIGSLSPARVPCSITERILNVLERNKTMLAAYTIEKNMPGDLPDVLADPALIEQALYNILENAVHFSPPGGKIGITVMRQVSEIIVSIEDQGLGLPKGQETQIFDKFCSFPPEGSEKRTGLGLTIASGILRLHKGRIWAENAAKGGARFSFSLPIA